MRRKVLQQTYSLRFSDFAMEFYSFVADNYAPFYSLPIEWDNVILYGEYVINRRLIRWTVAA